MDTPHLVHSVTKSYTSTLVAIAQADGDLHIDDQASEYIDEWIGTPSEDVTIRNLLSNDSGRDALSYENVADWAPFFSEADTTAYAIGLSQEHRPGEVWAYNDPAIQTLDAVLAEATGQEPADYADEQLFTPIGARSTTMGTDPSGNTHMGGGTMHTTCQDAARYGHLFLRGGDWNGTRVIPEDWVRGATAQPSQGLFPAYGLLWWLNRSGDTALDTDAVDLPGEHSAVYGHQTQLAPGAPEDMYWAVGAFGQVIQIDPASDTVVVRFGQAHPGGASGMRLVPDTARVVTDALAEPPSSKER